MFSKKVFTTVTTRRECCSSTNKDGKMVVTETFEEVSSGGDQKSTKTTTYSVSSDGALPSDFDKLKLSFDSMNAQKTDLGKDKFFRCSPQTHQTVKQATSPQKTVNGISTSKPSPTKSVPTDVPRGKFADDCLKAHNDYRAKHGTPPLKLSKKLCDYAQEWADHLAKTDCFKHRNEHKYGENIFTKWSSDPNHQVAGNEPVDSWYSEIKDHVFGREPTSLKSGHFTQVIWKGSQEMGVAYARSRSGRILVVANYDPAGNMIGSFTPNVPAPQKGGCCQPKQTTVPQPAPVPKTSPTKVASACKAPGKFAEDCLKSHNNYRAKHGTPPLKLCPQLCCYAQEWADHLARVDKFQHRTEHKYGENIFMKWSSDPNHQITGNEAVDSWYSEIKDHTFGREPTSLKSGHFTQVIWKSSKEMGVAQARSKSGKILVVANYEPAGNLVGTFTQNVPPPKK